jgi:hypothetical protein
MKRYLLFAIAVLVCSISTFGQSTQPTQTISCTAILGDSTARLMVTELLGCPIRNWGRIGATSAVWLLAYPGYNSYYDYVHSTGDVSTDVLLIGRNDITQSTPPQTTIANIDQMYQKSKAAGRTFILTTVIPVAVPTGGNVNVYFSYKLRTDALNAAILAYAQQQGITVVDFNKVLADPATGFGVPENMNMADGIHESGLGAFRMMQALLPAIEFVQSNLETFMVFGSSQP